MPLLGLRSLFEGPSSEAEDTPAVLSDTAEPAHPFISLNLCASKDVNSPRDDPVSPVDELAGTGPGGVPLIGLGTSVQLGTDDIAKAINRSWCHAHAVVHGSGTLQASGDRYNVPFGPVAWAIPKPVAPASLVNPGPDFTLSRQRVSAMLSVESSTLPFQVAETIGTGGLGTGDFQWWAVVTLRAFIDVYTYWSRADPEYDPPRLYYPREIYYQAEVAIDKRSTPGGDVGQIADFGSWDSRFVIADAHVEETDSKWHDDTGKHLYDPTVDIIKIRHFNAGTMLSVTEGEDDQLVRSAFNIDEASFTLDQVYPARANL